MIEFTAVQRADDERLAAFFNLTHARPPDAPLVLEGFTVLQRFLAAGQHVQAVLCTPAAAERLRSALTWPAPVAAFVMPSAMLRETVGFQFHRGVLALGTRPQFALPTRWRTVVVGEGITDPSNVGALIRNAAALGADALCFDAGSGDPFSRRAIRAAMGLGFALPVLHGALAPVLEALSPQASQAAWVAAACGAEATELQSFPWPARCVLFFGNEGRGLSAARLATVGAHVRIPMQAGIDSLNVAAASAVVLYARALQHPQTAAPTAEAAMFKRR